MAKESLKTTKDISFGEFKKEVLNDYKTSWVSRHFSLLARKEVLRGKAKFGIMGAGKELAQIAMAKAFRPGDYRAGYYRDQTFMLASGTATIKEMFALLYANPFIENEPHSAGRQMSSHFATRMVDEHGEWKDQSSVKNSSADTAPTASQMGRCVGLALASKMYRANKKLSHLTKFSNGGNEVTFATIGDAATSEGIFWEAFNAAGVQQIPLVFSVWDDGFGISVPKKDQTTKGSISKALSGFSKNDGRTGFHIYKVKGWDYPALIKTFSEAVALTRKTHTPTLMHVEEITQPQGHSTSGSHERYKSKKRLQFEKDFDCLVKMRNWLLANGLAEKNQLKQIEADAFDEVKAAQQEAWKEYRKPVLEEWKGLLGVLASIQNEKVKQISTQLNALTDPKRGDIHTASRKAILALASIESAEKQNLISWSTAFEKRNKDLFNTHLYSDTKYGTVWVKEVKPTFSDDSPTINGYEVLQKCFATNFEKYPQLVAFGEDLGKIGGVNQGMAGLQERFGKHRIWDTGIRELTIIGQGIGMAMRGLRPIAEIQYLDYVVYALQQITDELATLPYRTKGGQRAPMIIRTRGHRLEGIWHTGSHLGMLLNAMRGIHLLVPRNMTQAAGFYNTLLQGDEPGMVIEVLNGYRLKEKLPDNLADFSVPIGKVEIVKKGDDVTIVTYGACVRIVEDAAKQLQEMSISVEVIDIQSMLPFDLNHDIVKSLQKTNRVLFVDEDVPGGGTAFMLQKVLEEQNGYLYLDAAPITLTAAEHRAGYGAENGYFSKPQPIHVVETIYNMMHEAKPSLFP